MISSTDGKAWVVTNYRTVDDAVNDFNPIAAVAMEYQTAAGSTDCSSSTNPCFTKFYIYDRTKPDNPLVTGANLDGGGVKYLPGLCITCHGGRNAENVSAGQIYPNNGNVSGHFLPFDLNALEYSSDPRFTRDAQQDVFRQLNQRVLDIEVLNPDPSNNGDKMSALIELIEGWYGQSFSLNGASLLGPQHSNDFVASGWPATTSVGSTTPAQFYSRVIARSCRNCHSTRTDLGGLNFASLTDPSTGALVPALSPATVGPVVLGSTFPFTAPFPSIDLTQAHITTPPNLPLCLGPNLCYPIMSHARRTFERFWLNTSGDPSANPPAPPQPELFRRFICDYSNLACP